MGGIFAGSVVAFFCLYRVERPSRNIAEKRKIQTELCAEQILLNAFAVDCFFILGVVSAVVLTQSHGRIERVQRPPLLLVFTEASPTTLLTFKYCRACDHNGNSQSK